METKKFYPKTVAPIALSERTVQARLEVTPPHDEYEQEADKVADKVSRMPGNASDNLQMLPKEGNGNNIQMQVEEEDKVQMRPEEEEKVQKKTEEEEKVQKKTEEEEKVQKQADNEEDKIQMKPVNTKDKKVPQVSAKLASQLQSMKGNGNPLPKNINQDMGQKIGSDFSKVRVHTDSDAVHMSKELGAKAFTHGNDIYFNTGNYNPENSTGKHLLAHELTHTVQQGGEAKNQIISRQTDKKKDEQEKKKERKEKKDDKQLKKYVDKLKKEA